MASLPDDLRSPDAATEQDDGAQMTDSELVSILSAHEAQAIGYQPGSEDEVSSQQEQAINYYYGQMDDVSAVEGCSSAVDTTVQVVVDNALAAVLKPFVSSDETVCFSPRGPEDEDKAEQATEYVNFIFQYDNPGFLILHDWFKDALLTKLGTVKAWWEQNLKLEARPVPLSGDPVQDTFIRGHQEYLGEENGVALLGQQVDDGRVKIANIPPEEFRISPFARSINDAIYVAHVPQNMRRTDLIEMGFDPEIVETLPAYHTAWTDNTLTVARYRDERSSTDSPASAHPSQDRINLREEYVRVDYNGDGIAELRKIMRVADVVLLNEEAERVPFALLCPVPMPHKVFGLSLADLVVQEQRINTVLWRQSLDNLYKSNNPRPVVGSGAERMDGSTGETLADNAPGADIKVDDISQFRYEAVPYTAGASMPMMEAIGARIEQKTGVSLTGQGLDTNALKKSGQMTATEMAMIAGGKNARVEMIARIFAETGVKDLFRLILGLVSRHQPKARVIRLRNEWVEMNPTDWPEFDLEVSVGLGVGEKTEQIAQADSVLETMQVLAQSPYASLIGPDKVYNAVKRKFTAAGIKNTDDFLNDPQNQQEQGPPPPSPEEVKMQHDMQMAEAKMQMDAQAQAHKQMLAQQEAEFEANLAQAKAALEADLARQKMALEAELAQQKLAVEAQISARKADQAHEAKMASVEAKADLPENRPGGKLDE